MQPPSSACLNNALERRDHHLSAAHLFRGSEMLDRTVFETKKRAIIDRFGPWVANNIHLADDLYTIGKRIEGDEIKLRRVLQVVADATRRPLDTLRVLDLACLEGLYAIEFARHGATVVGIEGREA